LKGCFETLKKNAGKLRRREKKEKSIGAKLDGC
jgi:hypothetical protein